MYIALTYLSELWKLFKLTLPLRVDDNGLLLLSQGLSIVSLTLAILQKLLGVLRVESSQDGEEELSVAGSSLWIPEKYG